MTLRHRLPFALLFAIVITGAGLAGAARQDGVDPMTALLTARIPVDSAISTGTFENGLRYYVRANARPENRAELRLVVNAGSVLEDEDQRGLAHFVEHMAFNGTTNFPRLAIIQFMESIGMRFGPSVNAFTSFDETVYQLQIPTDRPEVIDRALLVLEDWAHSVTFDPEEVDKERGVIIEEWRLRRGAGARLQEQQFPVLLRDSRYATRMPIGTVDVLENFTHDRLKQFYTDWYRPDLMAVIAVGDFNPVQVEQMIRARFASLPAAQSARPRAVDQVPDHAGTAYAIATDPELASTQVSVYHTAPAPDESTVGSYRDRIVVGLFSGMLNARFAEIARKPDAPFLQASAGRGGLVRTTEATRLSAVVRENEVERGLAAMFEEAERVARFGFTATELDRQKRSIQRSIERAVADRHNHISADLAAEYSRNYLTTEPIPGIVYESRLYERFLPEITLAEVNALARDWSPDRNRVVMVSAPERLDVTVPTETALAAVMNGVASRTLTPYEDLVSDQPLLTSLPEPGRIVGTETRPALDITEWTLSNGVRVILKPTTFREDQILFQAFSPGGHSLVADEDFIAASTASQVIGAGGIGQLSELDLRKLLTGKVASVRPSIGPYHEGLSGSGSRQDLETLFQLIHLTFTQPRADAEIFQLMTDQTRVALENQTVLPEYAFNRVLNEALTQGHPRARMLTPESVEEMDLQRSLAIYRERFANASDFTFVFVGSFEPAMLQPFVERYLGSLPAFDRTEQGRDFDIRPAPGVLARRVAKGIEPKSQTSIVFSGPFEYDAEHRAVIRAMGMSLAGRLRNALREDLGGTYSVNASPSYTDIPKPRYTVNISFGSDPGRTEALTARVFAEIDRLKQEGPGSSELDDIKETLRRDYEANMRQNGFLLSNLVGRYQSGERVDDLFDMAGTYDRITPADVQAAARAYLDTDNYVAVQLFPEQPEE